MSNQWCNTRLEKPSCTSKPWQDTWEAKGRTQQVSSWPSSAPLARPLTLPGAGLCPTPLPSLWHSSDTNGWGVSSLLRRKWFYSQFPKPRLGWGTPWVGSSEEEAVWVCWIHLGKYKHTRFPGRLIPQISIVYSTRPGTNWAEEEKSPSIPRNVFLPLSRYLLAKCSLAAVESLRSVC